MASNGRNEGTFTQLTYTIQVQQTMIDQLKSKINEMKVEFGVKRKMADQELSLLKEKCNKFQRQVEKLEAANRPSNVDLKLEHHQYASRAESARQPERCPVASRNNDCKYQNTKCEFNVPADVEHDNSHRHAKNTDSSAVGSAAKLDREPTNVVQMHAEAENVRREEPTRTSEENKIYVSAATTAPTDLKTAESTAKDDKKTPVEKDEEMHFQFGPICALQELCMSRKWSLPQYTFYEERDNTYTVECTVKAWTIRVEGMWKKMGKRQAAVLMYKKLKNIISIDENRLRKNVETNGACAAVRDKGPALAAFVKPPASYLGHKPVPNVAKVTTNKTCKNAVDHPAYLTENVVQRPTPLARNVVHSPAFLVEHGRDRRLAAAEIPKRNANLHTTFQYKQPSFPAKNFDLAHRLRQSNNPGIRELKGMRSINRVTIPCCIEFLYQIEEEEGLTLKYVAGQRSGLPFRKPYSTISLSVSPGGSTYVGYGGTPIEGQEKAAHACLFHFKQMLRGQIIQKFKNVSFHWARVTLPTIKTMEPFMQPAFIVKPVHVQQDLNKSLNAILYNIIMQKLFD